MLAHRLRRWSNTKLALAQNLVSLSDQQKQHVDSMLV